MWGMLSVGPVLLSLFCKVLGIVNALKGLPHRPSGFPLIGPVLFILPAAIALALIGKFDSKVFYIWGTIALIDFLVEPGAYLAAGRQVYEHFFK
jgi:hypothetical protein